MSALAVVLVVLGVLIVLLFLGGLVASARRRRDHEDHLRRQLEEANRALAQARADDRGWDPALLEAAAREAAGGPVDRLDLVQVEDRPGTEEDRAVFRAVTEGQERRIVLGRTGGAWGPVQG